MKKMRRRMMRRIPQKDKQGGEQQLKSGKDSSYQGVYVELMHGKCHTCQIYDHLFRYIFI